MVEQSLLQWSGNYFVLEHCFLRLFATYSSIPFRKWKLGKKVHFFKCFFQRCTEVQSLRPLPEQEVELRSHVSDQVDIIIQMAHKVIRDIMCCSAGVPDKLPLRHFILHVRTGEVDGQQDQTVAQHIHSVCREAVESIIPLKLLNI